MIGIDDLLRLAEAYRQAEQTTMSAVSWRVFHDTKKIRDLTDGSDIQLGRFHRAIHWFSDNWPASAKWPAGVPRPKPQAAASNPSAGERVTP